jgi:hypothetical protein
MRHSLDDQINARMVELAAYSSWYPQFVFGSPMKSELALSLPQNWISVCSGRKLDERIENGRALTHWSSAKDVDIVILASPDYKLKSIRESNISLDIYSTQMPEQFIANEGRQIAGVLALYTSILGETNIPNGIVKHVYSPKRKGQAKAGFSRPGLIVTSEGLTLEALAQDPGFSLFQPIAHEVAHYFRKNPQWQTETAQRAGADRWTRGRIPTPKANLIDGIRQPSIRARGEPAVRA